MVKVTDINWLGAIPLGKINSWKDPKASTLTPVSFPGQDAGATEAVDTLGVIAYTNIEGKFTGKFESIQGSISSIKNILDGNQLSVSTIRSPFVNSSTGITGAKTVRRGNISTNTSTNTNQLIDSTAEFSTFGIQAGDYVKNLITGTIAYVSAVSNYTLTLDNTLGDGADIFPESNTPYAVTAQIGCKILSFEPDWELPGLSYCRYTLSIIQVKET